MTEVRNNGPVKRRTWCSSSVCLIGCEPLEATCLDYFAIRAVYGQQQSSAMLQDI